MKCSLIFAAILLPFLLNAAMACPYCDQATRQSVNAAIFDADFARTVGVMAVPSLAIGAIAGWLYFGGPTHGKH
jgi:hypothetical protein